MPSIDLPPGTVDYRVAGPDQSTAPAVVFLHGLLVNNELWTGVAERLAAAGIRSYAPNLPLGAHDRALPPDADLSPRGVARLVLDFLAALELTDVTLVGNDTGGGLCQLVIDADDSRIGRLVLTNCDAFEDFPPSPFGLLVAAGSRPGRLKFLMQPMRLRAARNSLLGFGGLVRNRIDAELSRRWVQPVLADKDVRRDGARFMAHLRTADLMDVSTRLGSFAKPVRIVWGTGDLFFKLALAERLRDAFPDARLSTVDGGRTFLPLDFPERVADEIVSLVPSG